MTYLYTIDEKDFTKQKKETNIDLMTDHFLINKDEIQQYVENKENRKYISIKTPGGYALLDAQYQNVEYAQMRYITSKGTYEIHYNPKYKEELERAKFEEKLKLEKEKRRYKLKRDKIIIGTLIAVGLAATLAAVSNKISYKKGFDEGRKVNDEPIKPIELKEDINVGEISPISIKKYSDKVFEHFKTMAIENENQSRNGFNLDALENLRISYALPLWQSYSSFEEARELGLDTIEIEKELYKNFRDFQERVTTGFCGSESLSYSNSPYGNSITINGIIYILEDNMNYADGDYPENSIIKDGYIFVPEENSRIIQKNK